MPASKTPTAPVAKPGSGSAKPPKPPSYLDPKGVNVTLNTKLWSMLMRNRFGFTEHRKIKIPGISEAKDLKEQMYILMSELGKGNLTASEANQLSKLVETGIKVFEITDIDIRLTKVEQNQRIGVAEDDFKLESEKV